MSTDQPSAASSARNEAVPGTLLPSDTFARRHIGPDDAEIASMLDVLGCATMDDLLFEAMPDAIRSPRPFDLPQARTEHAVLEDLRAIVRRNRVMRPLIGMGYHDTITPTVILRNILENPGWYTQYTPYQAEIAQGRLEALLNFQTMVSDLTGLPVANASLLDEATAAAEAMLMCASIAPADRHGFFVVETCHPQVIEVIRGRAQSRGIVVHVGPLDALADGTGDALGLCGALMPYPDTNGTVADLRAAIEGVRAAGAVAAVTADPLALTLLESPGELGADIAIGSTQRFGVPLGFGGPHAAYIATRETHVRKLPGRLVGVSRDADGNPALRLAIQTREQHIKRDRATSNICTAQVLLAVIAGMYAVYHGPNGLRRIGTRVHRLTAAFDGGVRALGLEVVRPDGAGFFDTVTVRAGADVELVHRRAAELGYRLRRCAGGDADCVGVSFDETTTRADVAAVLRAFGDGEATEQKVDALAAGAGEPIPEALRRTTPYLSEAVFNTHHSETEMLRYITHLQGRDLSLAQSMIPLGSCTMKLNATTEMIPVTWPEVGRLHPFAPAEDTEGYAVLFEELERWLGELTGFPSVSLQPNAGSQGEYTGLAVIRAYHQSRDVTSERDVCLIPTSAHGTNPASAIAAGFRVVSVKCDEKGNIDLADLRAKAEANAHALGAFMVTYPSTHGVFEATIHEACAIVHEFGGQVYLDGANMNAMVGIARPAELGADVCHLNLHKTFCIPHGGGGPGMGPIGAAAHLAPYLPGHSVVAPANAQASAIDAVSAAPYGSPSILPISWVYIAAMGAEGLRRATEAAILNANYMAKRLEAHYPIVYRGHANRVAHEFIVDFRPFEKTAGIRIDDVAKRLMDYGFHAPTMAWPVPGTLMIEPTESESRAELDRFCDALIAIRAEIRAIEDGAADRDDNVLRNAPHTVEKVASDTWTHAYGREAAAYPLPWLRERKFWPPVGRIDNPYGDRNLVCTCA